MPGRCSSDRRAISLDSGETLPGAAPTTTVLQRSCPWQKSFPRCSRSAHKGAAASTRACRCAFLQGLHVAVSAKAGTPSLDDSHRDLPSQPTWARRERRERRRLRCACAGSMRWRRPAAAHFSHTAPGRAPRGGCASSSASTHASREPRQCASRTPPSGSAVRQGCPKPQRRRRRLR